jgi:hypothetical protein
MPLSFSVHKKSGILLLLVVITALAAVEVPIAHMLIRRHSKIAAWITTALGLYGFVWLIAFCRSVVQRPIQIGAHGLELHKGFLWTLQVPFQAIARVQTGVPAPDNPGYLGLALGAEPGFLIELREPLVATGTYGIRRKVKFIGLSVDEPRPFGRLSGSMV